MSRLLVAAGSLAVFLTLAVLVARGWPPLTTVDHDGLLALHGHWHTASSVMSDVGSPIAVDVATAVAGGWLAFRRRWGDAVIVVVARLGELGTETLAKALVGRARPVFAHPLAVASGSSFPSGHAAGSAVLFGTLVMLVLPRFWWAAVGFCLAVAASRVTLGVHYPSDVVAGLALGLAWAAGMSSVPRSGNPLLTIARLAGRRRW